MPTDYLSLSMPRETRNYVPKLQALKNIFSSPALMAQLEIPSVPNRPYFGTVARTANIDVKVAAKLGCNDPKTAAACLRAAPLQALLQAQTEVTATELIAFAPSAGSKTLPRQPLDALDSGDFVRVPVMNGGNRDEMRLYVGYDVAAGRKVTPENYAAALAAVYGAHGAEVLAHYPLDAYPSAPSALGSAMSDYQPSGILANCSFLETARRASRHVPVYEYEFTDRAAPPVMDDPGFELGAVHSAELPYLFPHFSNKTLLDGPDLGSGSQRLSGQMVRYWAAFARHGRPDAKDLPAWPQFRTLADVQRLHPDTLGPFDAGVAHQCSFWQSLYPQELGR